ncbi:TVP38/TMEM64 family protein [Botrimarina hoheduenensis]|uniref:TVP38/TMEM64 family membrane protein n=1 Tax=Botrimarina hoheduenensis TaxID=2528000 RepID=A0A5C5VSD6_9BACT|nr:TVP38/TMEM64 family protein [Botrimarina hoheduenensis]TWT41534.1 TVP38/TMEM64 family inner membrane protein YdjZ [Botrimarina hoheduenensis]
MADKLARTPPEDTTAEAGSPSTASRSASSQGLAKAALLGLLVMIVAGAYWKFGNAETLAWLAEQESTLRSLQANRPGLVFGLAFLVYVTVTGLSLPGAALMTLLMGWGFGWGPATLLVSFAATAGATIAFLLSRYLFREAVQRRLSDKLQAFDQALQREGAFYLFTLRLIPAVPFFVINTVMGLTKIKAATFWWVSQLGMLPGTAVYCYAGSRIPDLQTLTQQGAAAVFSPSQLTQIGVAFTLLGVFPLAAKKMIGWLRPTPSSATSDNPF